MTTALRIATRGSRQAWAQATAVADSLAAATGRAVDLVEINTTGDIQSEVPLHSIGGQGVFVKEVQRAVLDGRADIAAHSAKDLTSGAADGLLIAAFTERRDARDALIGSTLDDLPDGATVASGSVRRRAQIGRVRPDLEFAELRGNIDTRLSKIPESGAIVMAVAALQILDMTDRITEMLSIDDFVPAIGQGCVAIECRLGDPATIEALAAIDHAPTRHVEVERAFLAELGSGCSFPVGGHVVEGVLHTFLANLATGSSIGDQVRLVGDAGDLETARNAARSAHTALN